MIEISAVSKSYTSAGTTVEVLKDLSFSIGEGEFVAILGEHGSGKTTLLNLIATLEHPDHGKVLVAQEDLGLLTEGDRQDWRVKHIALLLESNNLLPILSSLENILLPLSLLKLSKNEILERAKFALDFVSIKNCTLQRASQLSLGQQQKVAIARAIAVGSGVIIADEPTDSLDHGSAEQILSILQRACKELNKTIVLATRDYRVAEYCSRIIHIDQGKLLV